MPAAEAAAVAIGGAALGAAVGTPLGLALPLAVVGGANGAVSGWRGTYQWDCSRGVVAFVLDSTWALATTTGSLASHLIGVVRGKPSYVAELSRRQNRHVYRRGFQPRKHFAITIGNVVSGAGEVTTEHRRRLVTVHEDSHVWQARWLGPAYPVAYLAWMVGGAAAGPVVWLVRKRHERLAKVIETCSYYMNPFEWWAYSREGRWPPGAALPGIAWRRPLVRALEETPATPR